MNYSIVQGWDNLSNEIIKRNGDLTVNMIRTESGSRRRKQNGNRIWKHIVNRREYFKFLDITRSQNGSSIKEGYKNKFHWNRKVFKLISIFWLSQNETKIILYKVTVIRTIHMKVQRMWAE